MIVLSLDKEHAYALEETLRKFLEKPVTANTDGRRANTQKVVREIYNSLQEELVING